MIRMTEDLARAAAWDAADASARSHGGAPWTARDYGVFCQAYDRLWPDSVARRVAKEDGLRIVKERGIQLDIPHSGALK